MKIVIAFATLCLLWTAPASAADMNGEAGRLSDQARRAAEQGLAADAISGFEQALALYEKDANREKQLETRILLADALQSAGRYTDAQKDLEKALSLAQALEDKRRTVSVLCALGNASLGSGDGRAARDRLNQALTLARDIGYAAGQAAVLNDLGNLHMSQNACDQALAAYQQSRAAAEKAADISPAALAALNTATAAVACGKYGDALAPLEWAQARYRELPDSNMKAYGLINAGLAFSDLRPHLPGKDKYLLERAYRCLKEAVQAARATNNTRTTSYAYGYLGKLYEDEQQYGPALDLTRQAVFAAQQADATEALYRWEWQSGRILGKLGRTDEAIAAYRRALLDLHAIKEELSSCYANPGTSYRKTASTMGLELVKLLLARSSALKAGETADPFLSEARETLETVKVYELREYFKDDCIDAARVSQKQLDVVSERVAVIYPILLEEQVELLVSFSAHLKRFTLPVGAVELGREANEFRAKLEKRTTGEYLPHAQKLYDWLIRPLEKDLDTAKPDTLVFVPDGPLRTIPMAALHDGKQFLIERYPLAITPSLSLADPRPIDLKSARVLAMGLTEPVQGFAGLPYAGEELKSVRELYDGQLLMNNAFCVSNVEKELVAEPFSIVHIASHGHFGGDVGNTFILAYDEKFTMDRFGQWVGLFRFRDESLDLLALSACETAAGDEKAALGLAGVAVRAGASSALATLWHVNDPASNKLVIEFYQQLKHPDTSRAAALRFAQLKLLGDMRYDHPGYWAPFLLINNWL